MKTMAEQGGSGKIVSPSTSEGAKAYKNWLSPVVMTCSATELPAQYVAVSIGR